MTATRPLLPWMNAGSVPLRYPNAMSEHSAPTASEPNAQILQAARCQLAGRNMHRNGTERERREVVLVHEAVIDQGRDAAVLEESPSVLGRRQVRLAVERNLDAARATGIRSSLQGETHRMSDTHYAYRLKNSTAQAMHPMQHCAMQATIMPKKLPSCDSYDWITCRIARRRSEAQKSGR